MAVQLPLAGLLPAHPAPTAPELCADLPTDAGLWEYPHCTTEVLQRHAKAVGTAGELFFDSLMHRFGLESCAVSESFPYDRLLGIGRFFLRTQIKTTTHAHGGIYRFSASRGYNRSPGKVRPYAEGDFNLLGLVVLPENVMAFTTSRRPYQSIPEAAIPGLRARPQDTLEEALRALGLAIPGEVLLDAGRAHAGGEVWA